MIWIVDWGLGPIHNHHDKIYGNLNYFTIYLIFKSYILIIKKKKSYFLKIKFVIIFCNIISYFENINHSLINKIQTKFYYKLFFFK